MWMWCDMFSGNMERSLWHVHVSVSLFTEPLRSNISSRLLGSRFSFALTCSVSITFLFLWCPTILCYCPFFNLLVYYLHLVFFWCPFFPFPVLWVVCFSTTQHNYIFFHFYFFLHYHFLCSTVLCMFSLRTPLLFTCVILLSSPPSTLT